MRRPTVWKIRVRGPRACWTIPHLRADPYSSDAPTYSALNRILGSIYGKPEFEWEAQRVHVLNPVLRDVVVMRQRNTIDPHNGKDTDALHARTLRSFSLLVHVDYVIEAVIRPNPLRSTDVAADLDKHEEIFAKRANAGWSYRRLWLGTTDCPVSDWGLVDTVPPAASGSRDLGTMLWNLVPVDVDRDRFEPVFYSARLQDGVVEFPSDLADRYRDRIFRARHAVAGPSKRGRKPSRGHRGGRHA